MDAITGAADTLSGAVEAIPGFSIANDIWNEIASEKLPTKDPFYKKGPDGEESRRKPPEGATKKEIQVWKHIVNKAWIHDRNFLGSCYWMDLGLGLAPIVSLIPIIGPLAMYTLHARLISIAEELRVPQSMHAKMSANILWDFLMTLIPVLGAIFSWINACSTRNAALIDTWLTEFVKRRQVELGPYQRIENRPVTRTTVSSQPVARAESSHPASRIGSGQNQYAPAASRAGTNNSSRFNQSRAGQGNARALPAPSGPPRQSTFTAAKKKRKPGQASYQESGVL